RSATLHRHAPNGTAVCAATRTSAARGDCVCLMSTTALTLAAMQWLLSATCSHSCRRGFWRLRPA
ncbi:hypothetical protein IWW55_006857, partial [Coemansia sp. RSA 2706]